FQEHGYFVMPGFLAADEVGAAYRACEGLPKRRLRKSGVWYVREPDVLSDARLVEPCLRGRLVDAAQSLLDGDVHLIAVDVAETVPGGGEERTWHTDLSTFAEAVVGVNVCIYLQDMTPDIGPLHVLPGSHTRGRAPTNEEVTRRLAGELAVVVPAGTAVLLDSRLWHSSSLNRTDRPRRLLSPFFARKSVPPIYKTGVPASLRESGDARVRNLFSLRPTSGGEENRPPQSDSLAAAFDRGLPDPAPDPGK
ncbi:MAG: phytanoyl-CoA dioxygenase family protein, partial [Actinomycetota bacterium]|nr:phytanoyl-CoA dioxygenase family protein [Actinomycetota bacterium]